MFAVNGTARKILEEEKELAPSFRQYLANRAEGALGPNGFVESSAVTDGKLYFFFLTAHDDLKQFFSDALWP